MKSTLNQNKQKSGHLVVIKELNNWLIFIIEIDEDNLSLSLGPSDMSFTDYVQEGWRRAGLKDPKVPPEWFKTTSESFIWTPEPSLHNEEEGEKFFYLDNESVDIRGSIQVSFRKNSLVMFCSELLAQEIKSESEQVVTKWWQRQSKIKKTIWKFDIGLSYAHWGN